MPHDVLFFSLVPDMAGAFDDARSRALETAPFKTFRTVYIVA
jgi:hypothetical protein